MRRVTTLSRRPAAALASLVVALVLLAACGSDGSSAPAGAADGSDAAAQVSGSIDVFAAASLTDAFTEAASRFEATNPGVDVRLSFGASSALAQQISEGAPADVFASADRSNMQKAVDAGDVAGDPVPFATNALQIIVQPGNPEGIGSLADLGRPGLVVVTCSTDVPIGRYTAQALEEAGVSITPSSYEPDVKGIVTKVTSGEADAGVVYATDVTAVGDEAEGVDVPTDVNVIATYPVAVTAEAGNPEGGAAWIEFLTGPEGQTILRSFGFGPA
jgi:molybdate transport system substrate-binding protein